MITNRIQVNAKETIQTVNPSSTQRAKMVSLATTILSTSLANSGSVKHDVANHVSNATDHADFQSVVPVQQVRAIIAEPIRVMMKSINENVKYLLERHNETIYSLEKYAEKHSQSKIPYNQVKAAATTTLIDVLKKSKSIHSETKADDVRQLIKCINQINQDLKNAVSAANQRHCFFKHNGGKIQWLMLSIRPLKRSLIEFKHHLSRYERCFHGRPR